MIGIFDSGVGGLSVFREIRKLLPEESYIYYSDSAHCPYGEKTKEYIIDRAREISSFLISKGATII
ncbi:MAG: glutamate racemase, partial [Bacteroidales bacterium]|nr:glutamate racemase [Bacteroidales bacterium]